MLHLRMRGIFSERNVVRLISNPNNKNRTSAVLSVGTNSTRLLVADLGVPLRMLAQRSIGTRLGKALRESGELGEEPMRKTLDALQSHYRLARRYTDNVSVIATSAMRRADNAQLFIDRIINLTDCNVIILSGQEEASCSFRGAVHSLNGVEEPVGVFDIGGGSTEYAVGTDAAIQTTVSCEIGAVRLTEWFPALAGHEGFVDNDTIDQARNGARELLSPLGEFKRVPLLIAVGGTATTSAAVVRGHRNRLHRSKVTREALAAAFNCLCELTMEKRKYVPGMVPQRADILPAGMIVFDTALEILGHNSCTVSRDDLLLGYLLSRKEAISAV